MHRLENSSDSRQREIAYGILALGLIASVLLAAWTLVAKKKGRVFGRIFSFVILPLLAVLLVSCMVAFFKERFDRLAK
jgi:FtsH-binding integral membrane protein